MPTRACFAPEFVRDAEAGRLTRAELEKLRVALREVLEHAIRLGGSSVSDYVDAEGVRGFFQLEHCVYQRTGEPCRKCGNAIQRIVVAGRSTHYCAALSAIELRFAQGDLSDFLKYRVASRLLESKRLEPLRRFATD